MIRRPPRSTLSSSSAASDVYKRQLVLSHITVNKNMVPFDTRSPFLTSGLRVGTPAVTTRGLNEEHMGIIVDFIDEIISNIENEAVIARVGEKVTKMMKSFPLFS